MPFIIIFVFVALLIFYTGNKRPLPNLPLSKGEAKEGVKYLKIAGQNIKVDLALTPEQQAKGLSGRSRLPEGEGMLFVFPRPGKYLFWMKDMKFAIDIIWLAETPRLVEEGAGGGDLKIVYIKRDARPEDYPDTYQPDTDAKYVLEVSSGFSDRNNLKIGDRVGLSTLAF